MSSNSPSKADKVILDISGAVLPVDPQPIDFATAAKAVRELRTLIFAETKHVIKRQKVSINRDDAFQDELDSKPQSHSLARPIFMQVIDLQLIHAIIIPSVLRAGTSDSRFIVEVLRFLMVVLSGPVEGSEQVVRQADGLEAICETLAIPQFIEWLVAIILPLLRSHVCGSSKETLRFELVLTVLVRLTRLAGSHIGALAAAMEQTDALTLLMALLGQMRVYKDGISNIALNEQQDGSPFEVSQPLVVVSDPESTVNEQGTHLCDEGSEVIIPDLASEPISAQTQLPSESTAFNASPDVIENVNHQSDSSVASPEFDEEEAEGAMERWSLLLLEIFSRVFRTIPSSIMQLVNDDSKEPSKKSPLARVALDQKRRRQLISRSGGGASVSNDVLVRGVGTTTQSAISIEKRIASNSDPLRSEMEQDRQKRARVRRSMAQLGGVGQVPNLSRVHARGLYNVAIEFISTTLEHLVSIVFPILRTELRQSLEAAELGREADAASRRTLNDMGPTIDSMASIDLSNFMHYAEFVSILIRASSCAQLIPIDDGSQDFPMHELAGHMVAQSNLECAFELLSLLQTFTIFRSRYDLDIALDFCTQLLRLSLQVASGEIFSEHHGAMIGSGILARMLHNERRVRSVMSLLGTVPIGGGGVSIRRLEALLQCGHALFQTMDHLAHDDLLWVGPRKRKTKPHNPEVVDQTTVEETEFMETKSVDPSTSRNNDRVVTLSEYLARLASPRHGLFLLLTSLQEWRRLQAPSLNALAFFLQRLAERRRLRQSLYNVHCLVPFCDILRSASGGNVLPNKELVSVANMITSLFFSPNMSPVELQLRCIRSLFSLSYTDYNTLETETNDPKLIAARQEEFSKELEEFGEGIDEYVHINRKRQRDPHDYEETDPIPDEDDDWDLLE